jgi:hypothetical protein
MFIPSISIIVLGLALAGILMAADWWVWGLTYSNPTRMSGRGTPLRASELVDGFLHRMIATNEAVLPKAALEAAHAKPAVADDGHEGGGFKHVA